HFLAHASSLILALSPLFAQAGSVTMPVTLTSLSVFFASAFFASAFASAFFASSAKAIPMLRQLARHSTNNFFLAFISWSQIDSLVDSGPFRRLEKKSSGFN